MLRLIAFEKEIIIIKGYIFLKERTSEGKMWWYVWLEKYLNLRMIT